jgi:hypothetical protein
MDEALQLRACGDDRVDDSVKTDPGGLITTELISFCLCTPHAYSAGSDAEFWTRTFVDALGMDLYPHLDENFLARWKCDYFHSLAPNTPIRHTEFNLTSLRERGPTTREHWRTAFYYQLARGVNGFWNFTWAESMPYVLFYTEYRYAPVTHEIRQISRQFERLAPLLKGARPSSA